MMVVPRTTKTGTQIGALEFIAKEVIAIHVKAALGLGKV
jgi:hypothetical protein